jgi:hypothetical protein
MSSLDLLLTEAGTPKRRDGEPCNLSKFGESGVWDTARKNGEEDGDIAGEHLFSKK